MGPPGHLAIGFMAKPATPKMPLWVLLVATEMLDLLCFVFMAFDIEQAGVSTTDLSQGVQTLTIGVLPWSHGLFMSLVWSIVAAVIVFIAYRDRRASIVVGLLVFSHWILDFIVHVPDLPLLFDGSPVVGLGLWGSGPGLIISGVLEIGLLAVGVAIYVIWRRRRASDRTRA